MNSPNRKTLSSSFLVFVSACIAIALMLSCGSYAFADEIASSRSVDEPAVIIDTPSKIGTSGAVEAKPSSEPSENGSSSSASQAGDSNAIAPAIDTQNTPDSSVKKDEKTVGMASKPQSEVTGETKSASAGALVDETSSSAKASVKAESHAKVDAVEKTTDEAAIDSAKPMAKSAAKPAPKSDPAENCVNMIRLYNPNSGEHFYTSSEKEAENVTRAGWVWEGVGWVAPKKSSFPVYRLYNPNAGDHHYTVTVKERNSLRSKGWIYEGVGWYSHDESGLAVLRQYNPNAVAGAHNFTTSEVEDRALARIGWIPEGIAWRAVDGVKLPFEPRWLTTLTSHGREWQWVASDAQVAKDRLITPEEGAGCYSYARPDGCIVRGKWDNGHARVYVAKTAFLPVLPMVRTAGLSRKSTTGVGNDTITLVRIMLCGLRSSK